jgi:hypothetical protein
MHGFYANKFEFSVTRIIRGFEIFIPLRWHLEGDIVLVLSVRPSARPSVCPNFVSALVLWPEFNETL